MAQETILDYKRLEIRHKEEADEEIMALLEMSVVGTEGGLRYSVCDLKERLKYYGKGLSFIGLYKRNKLAGVIGLCRRRTYSRGRDHDSAFLRYLSVRSSYQINKVRGDRGKKLVQTENSFKQKIFSLFSNLKDIPLSKEDPSEPDLIYACVESGNERSKNFVRQAGYDHIRTVSTISFSRFNPKKSPGVGKLSPGEEQMMRDLLADQYRDYSFYTSDFSFLDNWYYVMRKENRIVAGVCAMPTRLRIIDFPGIKGLLLMKILPFLPYFSALFKPGEFRFIVLDSIYCPAGNEHLLPDLFEAVCASEEHCSAMTWLDDRSELCISLRKNRRMGVLNRILKTSPGLLYASLSNIDEDEKRNFFDHPAYIPGLDLV